MGLFHHPEDSEMRRLIMLPVDGCGFRIEVQESGRGNSGKIRSIAGRHSTSTILVFHNAFVIP